MKKTRSNSLTKHVKNEKAVDEPDKKECRIHVTIKEYPTMETDYERPIMVSFAVDCEEEYYPELTLTVPRTHTRSNSFSSDTDTSDLQERNEPPSPFFKKPSLPNSSPMFPLPIQRKGISSSVPVPNVIDNASNWMYLPCDNCIIVNDEEPSSVIAYALSTQDYSKAVPATDTNDIETSLLSKEKFHYKFEFDEDPKAKKKKSFHCTVYYAKQFAAVRKTVCNGDEAFIKSLTRCKKWNPGAGKSGSTFTKTWDDRYILKQVSRIELLTFLETGPAFFDYTANALFHGLPSILAKILGIYRVSYYSAAKGKTMKQDVVVMENLFYNRTVSRAFDLKGSIRNRYQTSKDAVLLDENLLEFIFDGSHLTTREMSKSKLSLSIFNDTLFLSKLHVMDYSLLVGIDDQTKELVVGIIDYMRQYTWDKV